MRRLPSHAPPPLLQKIDVLTAPPLGQLAISLALFAAAAVLGLGAHAFFHGG